MAKTKKKKKKATANKNLTVNDYMAIMRNATSLRSEAIRQLLNPGYISVTRITIRMKSNKPY